jgi:hypothetical protein
VGNPFGDRVFGSTLVLLLIVVLSVMSYAEGQSAASNSLISVVFKTDADGFFPVSPPMVGPDPAATSANPLFSKANVWNNLQVPFQLNTNPTWSNLVDSTGSPTMVKFSITGTVAVTDFWGFPPTVTKSPLQSPFIFWNSWTNGGGAFGPGESTTITWKLTGLPPATTFDMCIYGSFADMDRSFDMTIGATTMSIPTFNNTGLPRANCVLFTNITSDGHGTISGVGAGIGDSTAAINEANWSGFQLVAVSPGKGRKIGFYRAPPQ